VLLYFDMAINAEVSRNDGESTINLIRRFSKRVQGAGVITRIRGNRYHERPQSRYTTRKRALKSLKRREEVQELIKLGKMVEAPKRRGRR
jgi:ribosomal protein S21